MSYRILPLIWGVRLDPTSKLVLLRLAEHADDDGTRIFPSVSAVAEACDLAERSVQRAIGRLREMMILIECRPPDFAARRPTDYRIDLERLRRLAPAGNGCQKVTGDNAPPVTQSREPVTLCRLTGDTESPKSFIEPFIKSVSEEGNATAPAEYAWQGNVIKLTKADYDKWQRAYPKVIQFDAELQVADDYYSQNPPPAGKWFFRVSNWLRKANASPTTKRPPYSLGDVFEQARRIREAG